MPIKDFLVSILKKAGAFSSYKLYMVIQRDTLKASQFSKLRKKISREKCRHAIWKKINFVLQNINYNFFYISLLFLTFIGFLSESILPKQNEYCVFLVRYKSKLAS